jgi:hypothetical protein
MKCPGGMAQPFPTRFLIEPDFNPAGPRIAAPHNEKAVNTQYLAFLSLRRDIY